MKTSWNSINSFCSWSLIDDILCLYICIAELLGLTNMSWDLNTLLGVFSVFLYGVCCIYWIYYLATIIFTGEIYSNLIVSIHACENFVRFCETGKFPVKPETCFFSFVCPRLRIKWSQHVKHILQMLAWIESGIRRHQQSLEKSTFVFCCFIIYMSNLLITWWCHKEAHINMYQVLHTSWLPLFHDALDVFSILSPWALLKLQWPYLYQFGLSLTLELAALPYYNQ